MSYKRTDLITDPYVVLPHLKYLFFDKILKVCKPQAMFLVGSRGRTPVDKWKYLEGKDYDVLVVTTHQVINTNVWSKDLGFYIDITCHKAQVIEEMRKNNFNGSGYGIEIFPNTHESLIQFLEQ